MMDYLLSEDLFRDRYRETQRCIEAMRKGGWAGRSTHSGHPLPYPATITAWAMGLLSRALRT
jgi:hypothetical protein